LRWQNNGHSGVVTASTSGSCRLAQGDQANVPSARARTSAERKRSEALGAKEEDGLVPVIELVQRREAKRKPQRDQAEADSNDAGVEEPRPDQGVLPP
jgi:hypothetical protein